MNGKKEKENPASAGKRDIEMTGKGAGGNALSGNKLTGLREKVAKEGGLHLENMAANRCVRCGKPVPDENFRDDLSRAEFRISGLCQKCQDFIWREE